MANLITKYRTILANFGYLSILNMLDMALPLLIIPFITNAIGVDKYGIYMYVLVIVQNINLLTQYGFQFSATKRISQNRDDIAYVSQLTSRIICCRLLLSVLIITILLLCHRLIFDSTASLIMFFTAFGIILGDVFIPTWLFQGMEKMKFVTIVNATAKGIFALMVVLIIHQQDDYIYILLLNSLGYTLAAVLSIILARKQFHISFVCPTVADIQHELKEGLSLFGSTVGINLYRNLNVIILHFFVSDAEVGFYALAEKVIKACQSLVTPLSQALFPHMSLRIKQEGINAVMPVLKRCAYLILAITSLGCLCLWFLRNLLVFIVGSDFQSIIQPMVILFPVLIFGCLNFLIGFVGLVNMGQQKQFFYAVFASGTIAILLLLILVPYTGFNAAAYAMSASEILLCGMCLFLLNQSTHS